MKQISKKAIATLSKILHIIIYIVITLAMGISAFALYVKINTLDISFLIDYLKKEQIIRQSTTVESLHLTFDKAFAVEAKNIAIKADHLSIRLHDAHIELSRASLLRAKIAAKRIKINNADININLDAMFANKEESKPEQAPNYYAAIKHIGSFAKWTKSAYIHDSDILVIYNNEEQRLDDFNLNFFKSSKSVDLSAKGVYKLSENNSPINAIIHIDDENDNIGLEVTADNLKSEDLIKTFFPNDHFNIKGSSTIVVNANLDRKNTISNISGAVSINDGFVSIPSLYNNNLDFKEVSTDFNYDILNKYISFNKTHLIDTKDNNFDIFGDFSFKDEPNLNITVKNKQLPLLDAFMYIPDLSFTEWLDEHIYQGTAKNVSFGFYGPLRPQLDGIEDNPYFDISADFEDVALTYLAGIPAIENAKGKFKMLKKNIDINIESGTHSEQTIKRGSVNIAPLFEGAIPLITIKALSNGSVEDVLDVLNKKLDLKQDELFSHYKGLQETQSTITLNLDRLDEVDNYNPQKESFIKLDVRSDISEVTGIDPAFKQRFQATDAVVKLTEEDFTLEASGFVDENPFSLILQEKLLEFGEHTKLKINSNSDSFLIKEYLDIPTFNLSGLVYNELELEKTDNTWNFKLDANIEDSLVNFGLLNYNKPFSKPGFVSATGFYDLENNILNLKQSQVKTDDLNIKGTANIVLNNLPASTARYNNIIIKDKTNVEEFSLQSNILTIRGKSLDARPIEFMKAIKSDKEETQNDDKQTIKKINIRLDKLHLTDKQDFQNVSILLNGSEKLTGLIKAQKSANEQNMYFKLSQDEMNSNIVKLESLIPNMGKNLKRTGLYNNLVSGHGILFGDLVYDKNNKFDYANLELNVKKFQITEAPLLAQALASISLEQLFTKKDGILFDDLYTKIHYEDSILKLSEGKIKGPSLGILLNGAYDFKTKTTDIKGTLVPVVKLNSIVTNIPVLGYILTGSQGAISGADFKVYGSQGKQKVSVSPLSIITPGIVKDLFDSVSSSSTNESKAIKKARKKANIKSKPKGEEK